MPQVNYRLAMHRADIARHGEPEDPNELAEFLIAVVNRQIHPNRIVGFVWEIRYSDQVSNSHSAPLEGVQNWSRTDVLPCGYPGFYGRLWVRYAEPSSGSDSFYRVAAYTGTGGFGCFNGPWSHISQYRYQHRNIESYPEPQVYSWDFRFYIDDWPRISQHVERQRILWALQGGSPFIMDQKYHWEDPETVRSDRAFVRRVEDALVSV